MIRMLQGLNIEAAEHAHTAMTIATHTQSVSEDTKLAVHSGVTKMEEKIESARDDLLEEATETKNAVLETWKVVGNVGQEMKAVGGFVGSISKQVYEHMDSTQIELERQNERLRETDTKGQKAIEEADKAHKGIERVSKNVDKGMKDITIGTMDSLQRMFIVCKEMEHKLNDMTPVVNQMADLLEKYGGDKEKYRDDTDQNRKVNVKLTELTKVVRRIDGTVSRMEEEQTEMKGAISDSQEEQEDMKSKLEEVHDRLDHLLPYCPGDVVHCVYLIQCVFY